MFCVVVVVVFGAATVVVVIGGLLEESIEVGSHQRVRGYLILAKNEGVRGGRGGGIR